MSAVLKVKPLGIENIKRNVKVFQLGLKYNWRMRRDEHKQDNEPGVIKWVVDLEICTICQVVKLDRITVSYLGANAPIANPAV